MRLLQDGPVQTWMAEEDGQTIIKRSQDCTAILEQCHELRATGAGTSTTGDGHWAGRIPAAEVEKYINEHGITFREFIGNPVHVQRYLNDPDHKLLRIWTGRL
jgi:hypothetical protein